MKRAVNAYRVCFQRRLIDEVAVTSTEQDIENTDQLNVTLGEKKKKKKQT